MSVNGESRIAHDAPATSSQREPSPLERLPVELLESILHYVPDILSLRSLVLSCPAAYRTFRGATTQIIHSVIQHNIPPSLIPFAAFVQKTTETSLKPYCARLPPDNACSVAESCEEHKLAISPEEDDANIVALINMFKSKDFESFTIPWTPRSALKASQLHDHCLFFSERLSRKMLHGYDSELREPPPSSTEQHRILRTFYLFEIYCELFRSEHEGFNLSFGKSIRYSPQKQKNLFLALLGGYELEQLVNVRYYLSGLLRAPIRCMTYHSIKWGHDGSYGNAERYESNLSTGLDNLRKIVVGTGFRDWQPLLCCHAEETWMQAALWNDDPRHEQIDNDDAPDDETAWDPAWNELDYQEMRQLIKKPKFEDPDGGPSEAWWWAYKHEEKDEGEEPYEGPMYNGFEARNLLDWGYCFWDASRLRERGVLDREWELPVGPCIADWEPESVCPTQALIDSCRLRDRLCISGWEGYWEEDGENLVTTADGFFPKDGVYKLGPTQ